MEAYIATVDRYHVRPKTAVADPRAGKRCEGEKVNRDDDAYEVIIIV